MTKEEILNKAIYIQFPLTETTYNTYTLKDVNKTINKLPLPNGMLYSTWALNNHHFTTEYHRLHVIPLLEELFGFKFDASQYHMVNKMHDKYDISQLYPNNDFKFDTYCFNDNEKLVDVPYEILCTNPYTTCDITDYHRLFRYGYKCSMVINKTIDNNRKLLISGDSQMIPSVPTLCTLFKEVWYLDNRACITPSIMYRDTDFTDVLIELNCDSLDRYINRNIR